MSQRFALPKHPCQPPRPLITNLIAAQVKVSQLLALQKHPRKTLCAFIANPIAPQVKMSQRLALSKHLQQPRCRFPVLQPHRDHELLGQAPQILRNAIFTQRCA
eukprot:1125366-Rhodomonas_salina.2